MPIPPENLAMVGSDWDALPADAPRVSDDLDAGQEPEIAEELLVEEVSIDGMCGVY